MIKLTCLVVGTAVHIDLITSDIGEMAAARVDVVKHGQIYKDDVGEVIIY
jgi:hypothetical protein